MHRILKTAGWLASALIGLASCSDNGDDTLPLDAGAPVDAGDGLQPVTLRFKAKLGNQELVCGRVYAGQGSSKVEATPQDFRFFVQEVRLIDARGQEVPVTFDERLPFQTKDVALLDFTDGQGDCGAAGGTTTNMVIEGRVPVGTYKGVVFVNGVPESLNHVDLAVAPQPLKAPGASWDWRSGYRFLMAELKATASGDTRDGGLDAGTGHGAPVGDAGMDAGTGGHGGGGSAIHVGSTGCEGVIGAFTCARPNRNRVKLDDFDPNTNSIVADLSVIFGAVDLSLGSQCHGTGPTCVAGYAALGIDGNGQPATMQQVFRVE